MPPKKQATVEQTPSKSLLTFFDRSPNTAGPSATKPRASTANKPLKRRKSSAAVKGAGSGNFGTSNAPLVISDDEDVEQEIAMDVKSKLQGREEKKEQIRTEESVIDISDDDMSTDMPSIRSLTSRAARQGSRLEKGESRTIDTSAVPASAIDPVETGDHLISNGLLQSPGDMTESVEVNPLKFDTNLLKLIPAIPPVVLPPSQTSELEQALEEEEGEWNEGDEEGMGMEDLDINDDEEATIMEAMDQPSVDADVQEQSVLGGEKRKRKGKQKASVVKDCSPEVIALDESDQGEDDDSLGGREDVDDFDADDEECPICGRTFVGMRGDVSILAVGSRNRR